MTPNQQMKERARAIRFHIRRNWKRGKYTELHWRGYIAKSPVATPRHADDDVTLIGVYDGRVTTADILADIEYVMEGAA